MRKTKPRRHSPWFSAYVLAVLSLSAYFFVVSGIKHESESLISEITEGLTYAPEQVASGDQEREPVILVANAPTPAKDFLAYASNYVPDSGSATSKMLGAPTTFASWACSNITLTPSPLAGTQIDMKGKTSVIVHAYGAGQAGLALQSYRDGVGRCLGRSGTSAQVIYSPRTIANGFTYRLTSPTAAARIVTTWVRGDAVVSVASSDLESTMNIAEEYDAVIKRGLTDTRCLDFSPEVDDATRSPYYDPSSYTGWNRVRKVPVPSRAPWVRAGVLGDKRITGEGITLGAGGIKSVDPDLRVSVLSPAVDRPESPLPDGFRSELPRAVDYPGEAPQKPSAPLEEREIHERIQDALGPGCGWAWSGQLPPEWDDSEERQRVAQEQAKIEAKLINDVRSFVDDYVAWSSDWLQFALRVTAWNNYVTDREEILSEWRELNAIRQDYRNALDDYYAAVSDREDFMRKKREARLEYREALRVCKEYEASNGETSAPGNLTAPSPSPSPTDIDDGESPPDADDESPPDADEETDGSEDEDRDSDEGDEVEDPNAPECPPKRPLILDKDNPKKPKPPRKPSVPLPKSWDDIP